MTGFAFDFRDFSLSFLSVLFEGIPFLLLGSLISGFVAEFVPEGYFQKRLPRSGARSVLIGGLLGFALPICECGSVVVVRRFLRKGFPVSCAVTYMLAAPIVSPVVAASTLAAFRGQEAWLTAGLRMGLGYALAVALGLLVDRIGSRKLLRPEFVAPEADACGGGCCGHTAPTAPTAPTPADAGCSGGGCCSHDPAEECEPSPAPTAPTRLARSLRAIRAAASDFLEVSVYFVIGVALTSLFNTAVRQDLIAPLADRIEFAVPSMMVLAGLLALCSTSDAFVAASFIAFPHAAKLAFLVFGPMFDAKLFFLYSLIFKRRAVLAGGALLFAAVMLICVRLGGLFP
jgi:uncharacterized membrane protein YraQ (UPF0718 family)